LKSIKGIQINLTMDIESPEGLPLSCMGFLNSPPIVFYDKARLDDYLSDLVQVFFYLVQDPATFELVCKIVEDRSTLLKSSAEQASS
jgi:hypothetical protein